MPFDTEKRIYVQDVTLRDGMHAIRHQYGLDHIKAICKALDDARVDAIEVAHGDGLAGMSFNYGFAKETDLDYIEAAASVLEHAKLATLLLPGIGTVEDLREAYEAGARSVRVATHCTEADISKQHIEYARNLGMDVAGFLMMAHMTPPEQLAEQALMEAYGAHCVYVTDLGGAPNAGCCRPFQGVQRRAQAETQTGIHAHHNLSFGIANSDHRARVRRDPGRCVACRHGRRRRQCAARDLHRGRRPDGLNHGCDLFGLMDAAEEPVRPLQDRPVRVDRETLALGYAGVYSSFLRHAETASDTYGIDTREILIELGKRRMVGGQEDMIVDVAPDLVKEREGGDAAKGE